MKERNEHPTECPSGHPTLDEALGCWRCQLASGYHRNHYRCHKAQKGEDDENRQ